MVVVDSQAGAEYDGIGEGSPIFSPDGKRMAYTAYKGDRWLVVVDSETCPKYDGMGRLIFSSEGKRAAYTAKGTKWFVVVDGQIVEYDMVIKNGPSFHADGTLEFSRSRIIRSTVLNASPCCERAWRKSLDETRDLCIAVTLHQVSTEKLRCGT